MPEFVSTMSGTSYFLSKGAALVQGGGVPAGFSLWKTETQTWRFGTQRAISPART